jgi:pimeloyl-[acyl-carrier protein] synthase
LENPYAYYARLRAEDPVHLGSRGVWTLTKYDDVNFVLRDSRFGRQGFADILGKSGVEPDSRGIAASLLFQDPPNHTRLRIIVNKAFTPGLVPGLREEIQRIADGLIDGVRDLGAMDLIADFAFRLPVYVISDLLGVPAWDREALLRWSLDIAIGLESPCTEDAFTASLRAHDAIADYFRGLIAERRKRPRSDLLTRLIAAEDGGDKLTEFEVLDVCVLLFVTGHQTTINLIGNGMLCLLRHPIEMRRLHEDPGLMTNAVEELLRYESPAQRTGRMANMDVAVGGKTIPKGAVVLAMLGSANRDPAQFPEPDRLDVTRRENRHLAFGAGARFCLGAVLARMEGNIAIGTLLRRLPNLLPAPDPPVWRSSIETRALKKFPLIF